MPVNDLDFEADGDAPPSSFPLMLGSSLVMFIGRGLTALQQRKLWTGDTSGVKIIKTAVETLAAAGNPAFAGAAFLEETLLLSDAVYASILQPVVDPAIALIDSMMVSSESHTG